MIDIIRSLGTWYLLGAVISNGQRGDYEADMDMGDAAFSQTEKTWVSLKHDGPDDGSDGMACDGPPAHARVWRASGPSAKTTGRLILFCMFCHVE